MGIKLAAVEDVAAAAPAFVPYEDGAHRLTRDTGGTLVICARPGGPLTLCRESVRKGKDGAPDTIKYSPTGKLADIGAAVAGGLIA